MSPLNAIWHLANWLAPAWCVAAMMALGLTLAAWCAQRLAEQMDNAAVQAEPDLWAAVDPARFAWRQGRRASA